MDLSHALALYDAEVRAYPAQQPGFAIERTESVVRITGPFNFVSAWTFEPDDAPDVVKAHAEHFRGLGETLLWRVHDHDRPANLSARLSEAGFLADESTTLMLFDLANPEIEDSRPSAIKARRISTTEGLDDFVRASGLAFGEEEGWRRQAYAERLADPDLGLYVAYVGDMAAAAARIEMSGLWSFGLLQGGGVAPEHRRQGLYRALVAARAQEARSRGLRYLASDARETSRPILQRLGFAPASRAVLWTLRP